MIGAPRATEETTPQGEFSTKSTGWIVSLPYDLTAFSGSIFVGLAYGFLVNAQPQWATAGNVFIYLGLGLPHFASTWAFYCDRANLNYFNGHRWSFYYLPAVILAVSLGLAVAAQQTLLVALTYWFSGFHVMKQSAGLGALYRLRLGLKATSARKIDNLAILGVSSYCLVARYRNRVDLGYETVLQTPWVTLALDVAAWALVGVIVLWALATIQRWRTYGHRVWPLTLFTLSSLALFTPFLYVDRFADAFMASLVGHYAQYLGLVWLINRRKYRLSSRESLGARLLHSLSQNVGLLSGVLVAYSVLVSVCTALVPYFPALGLTWVHFFVDRYLFRFRDPYVRGALLPHLQPSPRESGPRVSSRGAENPV